MKDDSPRWKTELDERIVEEVGKNSGIVTCQSLSKALEEDYETIDDRIQILVEKGEIYAAGHGAYAIPVGGKPTTKKALYGTSEEEILPAPRRKWYMRKNILTNSLILGFLVAWGLVMYHGFWGEYSQRVSELYSTLLLFVLLPVIQLVALIHLGGRGKKVSKLVYALTQSELKQSADRDAVIARLANAFPVVNISFLVLLTASLALIDFMLQGELNNQIYGLTFDTVGGVLLAQDIFSGKELTNHGNGMIFSNSKADIGSAVMGFWGLILLISGFVLQIISIVQWNTLLSVLSQFLG